MRKYCFMLIIASMFVSLMLSACGSKDINKMEESIEDVDSEISIRDIDERINEAKKDGYTQILVGDAIGKDSICVPIYIVNNPGLIGISFSVCYDENQIELEKVESNKEFETLLSFSHSKELKSGSNYMWCGETIAKEDIKDGEILKLYFNPKAGVDVVKTPITVVLTKDGIYDDKLSFVNAAANNGFVLIKK